MNTLRLQPSFVARLAYDVYSLTGASDLESAYKQLNNDYKGVFDISENQLIKGKTGAFKPIRSRTAFGFTITGKNQLKNHAFILLRGSHYLADWLTNLNATCSRSAFNQLVHDGFNQAFKSMMPQIAKFMETSVASEGIHTIHCVGHSLGGALASLCAEWIKANYGRRSLTYTFGSPRVGLEGFASNSTRELGGDSMFRAYHKTDVVPYLPVWPYVHTPSNDACYYLPSPGVLPGAKYHSMSEYMTSVRDKSWLALSAYRPENKSDFSIAAWLKEEGWICSTG
ncbi:lipase family protein [Marinimicrobium sp. ARAG 43.8]|uniref:lipase family protein n=1 Tax=Marinimicrobium sp. ARAG 43.8 TaxID=3418719 RepID=UPI003CF07BD7